MTSAQSSTVRVKGPIQSIVQLNGKAPYLLTRPNVGFSPTIAAHRRWIAYRAATVATQRTVHEACGYGGTRSRRGSTGNVAEVPGIEATTKMFVFTGSAGRKFVEIQRAQMERPGRLQTLQDRRCRRRAGWLSTFEPAVITSPLRSNASLCASGTPCSGPRRRPFAISSSAWSAAANAASPSRLMKQLILGWTSVIRVKAASVTAREVTSRRPSALLTSTKVRPYRDSFICVWSVGSPFQPE